MPPLPESAALPSTIGPFRVLRELGSGGTSTVYLAERTESFSQRVAVKLLHPTASSAPLAQEQRLLSSMEHGNIVRLLDHGVAANGRRFLVMEYVDGLPIDAYCDVNRLPLAARIKLLIEVMAGVDYAHRHMVVHADLKPSNILVDTAGAPRLLDFGIASMLGSQAADRGEEAPQFTPAYASPEQKLGAPVSVASDVYSLGVTAALVLTGIMPGAGLNPERRTSAAGLQPLGRELQAILTKALEPAPERRYGTIAAFSEDLKSHLNGWPISATPVTASIRLRKWVRRNRLVASLSAVVLFAITFSAVGVTVQTARAEHQRRVTQMQLQDLVRLTGELDGELFDSVRPLAASDAAKKTLLLGATKTLDRLAAEDGGDPQVAVGVAQQYERLARSWMSLGNANGAAAARLDVERAEALLEKLPAREQMSPAALREMGSLKTLKDGLVK